MIKGFVGRLTLGGGRGSFQGVASFRSAQRGEKNSYQYINKRAGHFEDQLLNCLCDVLDGHFN